MWISNSGIEYCFYRFSLNGKELAFVELQYRHNNNITSECYTGYYFDKKGEYFKITGNNLKSILFKAIVMLKYSGWEIEGFPVNITSI